MKKIILTILIAVGSASVYAQLGVTAGLNLAKYSYNNGSNRKALMSFNAGLSYKTPLSTAFKWQPELLYTGKGAISYLPTNNTIGILKYTNHLNYIQLGSPFVYNLIFDGEEDNSIDFGVGPYVAYLIAATNKTERYDGTKSTRDFAIGNGATDEFKPLDAGITFLVGATINNNFGVHFKYDMGIKNLEPNPNYSTKLKTGNFAINFTYFFNK